MIKLWVHSTIAAQAGSNSEWEFTDSSQPVPLRAVLENAFSDGSFLRQSILDETGAIRQHINIFIGYRNAITLNGLETKVDDGTEISIFPSVSGG